MVSLRASSQEWIARLYERPGTDPSFEAILKLAPEDFTDDDLAELIESDGRARTATGHTVDLDRYLSAVSGLPERKVPLDAAIDVTFRSMCPGGRPTAEAIERLEAGYPELAMEIHNAAMLGE